MTNLLLLFFLQIFYYFLKGDNNKGEQKGINRYGDDFNFTNDFILKTSLVLIDSEIRYRLKNFNKENINLIKENWDKITSSIRKVVEFLTKIGINSHKLLRSNNAIIPLVYYIFKNNLENKSIVSFSDAHSFWPYRLGREATIFKKCESYLDLVKQLREQSFIGTIETDPAYGKYHWDGHAKCNFSCGPEKTKELEGKCPVCGKNLIVGVESRVEDLAEGENYLEVSPNLRNAGRQKMFYTLLPLHEIISLWVGVGMNSKKVWGIYNFLIEKFKTEFNILLDVSEEEMVKEEVKEKLIELILKNRKGKIKVKPGYDGKYGVALIENFEE